MQLRFPLAIGFCVVEALDAFAILQVESFFWRWRAVCESSAAMSIALGALVSFARGKALVLLDFRRAALTLPVLLKAALVVLDLGRVALVLFVLAIGKAGLILLGLGRVALLFSNLSEATLVLFDFERVALGFCERGRAALGLLKLVGVVLVLF